ncbi:hypothetical protein HAP94_13275 [Acidithiobacillus ferrivorans]|nr:hypothetical protein [Acidithiobacillus ferrivorans]
MTHQVTIEAFLHGATSVSTEPVAFLKDRGGEVAFNADKENAHVVFNGNLTEEEAKTALDWAADAHHAAATGAITVLIDKCEPNNFEWHDINSGRQPWKEQMSESLHIFEAKFIHLSKNFT